MYTIVQVVHELHQLQNSGRCKLRIVTRHQSWQHTVDGFLVKGSMIIVIIICRCMLAGVVGCHARLADRLH